jgi:EmrB/QacA subfamily drug resistance transporter
VLKKKRGRAAALTVGATVTNGSAERRRWAALAFICLAQLMIVLDVTIVNIALPSAQHDLGASDAARQWVITAYTLAFGSLLLLGGRIADYTGRKRAFLVGLTGFAAASAIGGLAPNFGVLLGARALQGAFAAVLAPAALSLLAVNFTEPRERAKAFGIFGAIAAGGGAVGLLLGGLLTQYLDWRWCLYVNIPVAVVAAIGVARLVTDTPKASVRARFDVPGVVLVTGALFSVVYACSQAESHGWSSALVLGLFAIGAALFVAFVVVERRAAAPILPLKVVLDRTRGSAYAAIALVAVGMFGLFLFFTYQMQVVMGYSAALAGVAFLPMTGAVLVSAGGIASRLLAKVPPRVLVVPGLLLTAAGLWWASGLTVDGSYLDVILPAELLIGFGMGWVMAPCMSYATHGVADGDSGIASAMANTSQQIGASIGTALLNTLAASATSAYLVAHGGNPALRGHALVAGFHDGFLVAAAIVAGAAVLIGLLMKTPRPATETAGPSRVPVGAGL